MEISFGNGNLELIPWIKGASIVTKKDFLEKEEKCYKSKCNYVLLNVKKWPIQFCKMVDLTD